MTPAGPTRRGLIAGAAALTLAAPDAGASSGGVAGQVWSALKGWDDTAATAALVAFGDDGAGGRAAFEAAYVPELLDAPIHLTAYYEPELVARRQRAPGFETPVLAPPSAWPGALPTRPAIEEGALGDAAEAIAWLPDRVSLFFLQVQGSGRLRLEDEGGRVMRVGYAGRNDHPYVSIGAILRQEQGFDDLEAEALRAWLLKDDARGAALMARNPSYIFFHERTDLPAEAGPVGAWGRPLPAGHAVAVDPAHHTYGALFWIEPAHEAAPALWMAMDTGAAIRGVGRFDLFLGSGEAARLAASPVDGGGRVFRLAPRRPEPQP
ncbi:MAG: MltA domain-containing protein [Pseudomonadota bacterium]